MNATFPMRTGDISYQIGLSVPAATGSWSVSLGFLDQNENAWNISGMSGKIYDNTGYVVGGYNSNVTTTLQGVISGGDHSLYQDGILLSNTQNQEENDYNMVSISGTYLEGYLPSVSILGDNVVNESQVQTVPFWKKRNDDKVLFVTENITADLGFIQAISGMGFRFQTGILTGVGAIQVDQIESTYGLVIFGAATSSGLYTGSNWNALNLPMMSLNSHLVCPQNLGWYNSKYIGNEEVSTVNSDGDITGAVFPQKYLSPASGNVIWAEMPVDGWMRMEYDPANSSTNVAYYSPYGIEPAAEVMTRFVRFTYDPYGSPAADTTIVLGSDAWSASTGYVGDLRPGSTSGLTRDLEVNFLDIGGMAPRFGPSPSIVTVRLSNTLGGTGAIPFTWTGTNWGEENQLGGREIPQRVSYHADNLYRRTTLSTGLYPTEQFNMYEGPFSISQGMGGDTLVSSTNTGNIVTAFHKGFWTGNFYGDFAKNSLLVFSVTPTGTGWTTGQSMWDTLSKTGKQLFVNSVAGFFIE
jgi:hypothetical protein